MTPKTPQIAKFVKTSIFNDGRKNRKKNQFWGFAAKELFFTRGEGFTSGAGGGRLCHPGLSGDLAETQFPITS